LDDISTLINPLKPQLDELKDLLKNGGQLAQNAQEKADRAEDEAIAAKEVRKFMHYFVRLNIVSINCMSV